MVSQQSLPGAPPETCSETFATCLRTPNTHAAQASQPSASSTAPAATFLPL